jgi:Major tropism determinant N-terminal domain
MSLKIRRGTDAERTITPLDLGEIVYTTDTKQLYVGNGIDAGGTPIIRLGTGLAWADAQCTTIIATGAALQVSADSAPSLGGNLNTAGFNISGTGNISTTAGSINTSYLSITGSSITSTAPAPTTTGYIVNSPVQIGINATPATLVVKSSQAFGVFTGITNGTNNSGLIAKVSRNTLAAPTTLQPGDSIWYQQAMGYDGTSFQIAGAYGFAVDPNAVVTTGHVPGQFGAATISATGTVNYLTFNSQGLLNTPRISVGDGTASAPSIVFATDGGTDSGFFHPLDGVVCITTNAVERVRVDNGGMRVQGFMKVGQVNGTLPSPPEEGMIVLDGTTFKGYTSGGWVNLN